MIDTTKIEPTEETNCRAPENRGYCCCSCRYHMADHSHPLTDGGNVLVRRGWICHPPEFGFAFSGWSEHGLCEMHEFNGDRTTP